MNAPDFESLGQYIHAHERFERALSARYDALVSLHQTVEQITQITHGRPAPVAFDPARCSELLSRAAEAHAGVLDAMSVANNHAAAARREPLALR